jgi:hypothetical protein
MISVGCEEKLELCRGLVDALHTGSGGRLRVAVGGAVLERSAEVQARTGADVATNDPHLAMSGGVRPVAVLVHERDEW